MPYSDPEAHNRRYGAAHKAERARWRPIVAAGGCACVRCGRWISPMEPWDLDHMDDGSPSSPAHRGCNRSAGAARSNLGRSAAPGFDAELHARRVARGCPPEWTGGPDDPRRDANGVLHRKWGEW